MEQKHLFVGFGDISSRCARALVENGDQIVGVARSERAPMVGVEFYQGDAKSDEVLLKIASQQFDTASIILSPSEYSEQAYRETYYDVVNALIGVWKKGRAPQRIVFISSTSVYAQDNGEHVNESSPAEPQNPGAKILREAEQLLLDNFEQGVVIRFAGIYGPGRDYLLRQVQAGKGGNHQHTNRIHIDDCCGVLLHILQLDPERLKPIYLASDSTPVRSNEIRAWLAEQMQTTIPLQESEGASARGGDKLCDNALLRESGYVFKYPSYQKGYEEVLKRFLEAS